MKHSRALTLGILLLIVPVFAMADAPIPPDSPDHTAAAYRTEQEWIVSDVCRNAFELLALAKDKNGEALTPAQIVLKQIPGNTLTYNVSVKGAHEAVEATLHWPGSIWSPAAYVPFCQAAALALKLAPAKTAASQGNALQALLDFSESAIEAENQRVSHWLETEPDNAAAQEQAALIVGTLAMKENSGYFWDPREACNQTCAHLAVAQFLRAGAPASVEGRLADILVGLIVDTKAQTGHDLDVLAAEKNPPAELAAWINACRMRNTRDWRIVPSPEKASPLEQVEYFRAYSEAVNIDLAIGWLTAHSINNRIDWTRIVLESRFSVDAGHMFAENSIGAEVHTMQTTFPGSFGKDTLVNDLNQPPGDAVTFSGPGAGVPTVINRGLWAQFFQRHLCNAIAQTGDFFANKWAVPENTQALDRAVNGTLSGLTFFPYLQLVQQNIRSTSATPAAAFSLFKAHPAWGGDFLVYLKMPGDPDAASLRQAATAWFNPPVVQGTAYGAMSRAPADGWSIAQTDQLYAIAPLQFRVAQMELARLYGKNFTIDQIQKVMGPMLDYFVEAIDQAKDAQGLTFDQRVQLVEKSAAIDPHAYYDLAMLYGSNHQEDEAMAALQEWVDKESDRVEVSNEIQPLVDYYYSHGQKDKALAVATEAAEVYSYRGLRTMMKLQETMGNLDKAEDYAQKIKDRYDDAGPLIGLYKRHADKGEGRFQAKFDDLAQTIFPYGLKQVTVASFSGAPTSGIQFQATNAAMQVFGLSSDQVVVALDGYAVQSAAQYTFVRNMSASPEMHFIVWDGGAYKEIEANRPGRLFGVELQDYHH